MDSDARRLNPSQVAEILQISRRSLRRWAVAVAPALSESARRKGRKRTFDGGDVETLRKVHGLLDEGLRLSELANHLQVRGPDEEISAVVLPTEVSMVIGELRERALQIASTIESHDDRIQRIEKWARLPWWKKIFTQPD